jgi:hypothetical protein
MWAQRNSFKLVHSDGSSVANTLVMEENGLDFYIRQFPPPANCKPLRIRGR